MQTFEQYIKEHYPRFLVKDEHGERIAVHFKKLTEIVADWQKTNSPKIEPDWNKPDSDQIIHVPDDLDPLIANVGMQLGMYANEIKSQNKTICDIVRLAEEFFHKKWFAQS